VYLAQDLSLGRQLAIKVMLPGLETKRRDRQAAPARDSNRATAPSREHQPEARPCRDGRCVAVPGPRGRIYFWTSGSSPRLRRARLVLPSCQGVSAELPICVDRVQVERLAPTPRATECAAGERCRRWPWRETGRSCLADRFAGSACNQLRPRRLDGCRAKCRGRQGDHPGRDWGKVPEVEVEIRAAGGALAIFPRTGALAVVRWFAWLRSGEPGGGRDQPAFGVSWLQPSQRGCRGAVSGRQGRCGLLRVGEEARLDIQATDRIGAGVTWHSTDAEVRAVSPDGTNRAVNPGVARAAMGAGLASVELRVSLAIVGGVRIDPVALAHPSGAGALLL
jgi:hypothetical protein